MIGGIGVAGLSALVGLLGFAATQGNAETPAATPAPAVEATPVPALPPPQALELPKEAQSQSLPPQVPFGPIEAEPYRVFTGDGDCLNVRPVPGTIFQSDPRTCVPEGFLLWLYGEPVDVDGHTWRYALGEGWVAIQYVKPAAGAEHGFGPFSSVLVSGPDGNGVETRQARIESNGSVTELGALPSTPLGMGSQPALISPDGKYAAYGREERYIPTLTIRELATGIEQKYPQLYPAEWSSTGRLAVQINEDCPQRCRYTTGWIDPRTGTVNKFTETEQWYTFAWAPDGKSIVAVEDGAVIRIALNGERATIVPAGNEIAWGQLAFSPDGRRLLSGAFQGPVVVVELATGAITRIERATQIPVGGRCGGSIGQLTTWLDNETVIWHESYAEKGSNGITMASTNEPGRRLIPFFTVSDIRTIAPGLVSFTTWESVGDKGFPLTWLLDADSGEARPVTVGQLPVWQ